MFNRYVIFMSCSLLSSPLLAFPCFFTLMKDSCWTDYTVTVKVMDAATNKDILTTTVPAGKSWVRESFTCEAKETLRYTATFTPVIWENTEGVVYKAQHFWQLPSEASAKVKAWDIPVCFSSAFAEVPFPPKAAGNCTCNFLSIPAIPLQPK